MERILKCFLAFFILFSTVDLSVINLFESIRFDAENQTSISSLMKIESDLLYQTKKIITKVCDNIATDVNLILTSKKQTNTFIDLYNLFIVKDYLNYCILLVVPIAKKIVSINFYTGNTKIPLFFFGFIFLFLLKYLGLLFTFDGIIISKQYKKAYSM